jgi:hypothetical protein
MNIKRTALTALASLAIITGACSKNVDDNARSLFQQVETASEQPAQEVSVTPDSASTADANSNLDTWALFNELADRFDATTDFDEALELTVEMVALLESDPETAGGVWELDEATLADYTAQFGMTVEDIRSQILSHPVLGSVFGPGASEEVSIEWEDTGWEEEEWEEEDWDDDEWDSGFESAFLNQDLADAHTGPWGDMALGRCTGVTRISAPEFTYSEQSGSVENGDLMDAVVTQTGVFTTEAAAISAFDEIDFCHVPASVSQFLQALGFEGYEVSGLGYQISEMAPGMQTKIFDYADSGLPVALVAIQQGDVVSISIAFGAGMDGTYSEAMTALG